MYRKQKRSAIKNIIISSIDDRFERKPDLQLVPIHIVSMVIGIREIILLKGNSLDAYLNVNNHYEGCVPVTIEKINKLFRELETN